MERNDTRQAQAKMLTEKQFASLQLRIAALPNELSDMILEKLLEFDHPAELCLTDFVQALAFKLNHAARSRYAPQFFATTKFIMSGRELRTWIPDRLTDWHRKAIKHVGVLAVSERFTTQFKKATEASGLTAGEVVTRRLKLFAKCHSAPKTGAIGKRVFAREGTRPGDNREFEVDMKCCIGYIDVTGNEDFKWSEEVEMTKFCF